MAWTEIIRPLYERASGGYASDLTDQEWTLLRRFMPRGGRLERPRTTDLRAVVNTIFYVLTTGCHLVGKCSWLTIQYR